MVGFRCKEGGANAVALAPFAWERVMVRGRGCQIQEEGGSRYMGGGGGTLGRGLWLGVGGVRYGGVAIGLVECRPRPIFFRPIEKDIGLLPPVPTHCSQMAIYKEGHRQTTCIGVIVSGI